MGGGLIIGKSFVLEKSFGSSHLEGILCLKISEIFWA